MINRELKDITDFEKFIEKSNPFLLVHYWTTSKLESSLTKYEKIFSVTKKDNIKNKYIDLLLETLQKCLRLSEYPKAIALFKSFTYITSTYPKVTSGKYLDLLFLLSDKLSDSELTDVLQHILKTNNTIEKIIIQPNDQKETLADLALKKTNFQYFELLVKKGVKTTCTKQHLIQTSLCCPSIKAFQALQKSSREYTGDNTFLVEESLQYTINQYFLCKDHLSFEYGKSSNNLHRLILPIFLNTKKNIEKIITLTNNIIFTYQKIERQDNTFHAYYTFDIKNSMHFVNDNKDLLSKLKEETTSLLKELKNIDENAASQYIKIFNYEEVIAKSSAIINAEREKITNDSDLSTNAILNNDYTLLADLCQEYKVDITRGLTLGGSPAIKRLLEQAQILQKDTKDRNDINIFETLQYYQNNTLHLNHQLCNIFTDILNEKFDKPTLNKIIKTNPNIKDILLDFIKTLSPDSQAYIFNQSVIKGTNLFIIWETARKEGQSPKVTKGALKEVKDNFERYQVQTAHEKDKVLKEILIYQKQFQEKSIVNTAPDLKEEKIKAIKRDQNIFERAFNTYSHDFTDLSTLYRHIRYTFNSAKEIKNKEEDIWGYTFALANPKLIMRLIEKNQGADAILVNSFLNTQLKKREESFQKLMKDILENKLCSSLIKDFAESDVFVDRAFHYLNSLPPEKEHSILHTALSQKTSFSYILSGNRTHGSMGRAYQRMKTLEKMIAKQKELTLLQEVPTAYKNIFTIFFQLQSKYQKELDQSNIGQYRRLKIRLDVCTLCLKTITNGEMIDKNIMQTIEQTYSKLNIFKEGNGWNVFSYRLADAINELLRVQEKMEHAVTACETTSTPTSSEPESSVTSATRTDFPLPSAPPKEGSSQKTYESSHSIITNFMASQQTTMSSFSFIPDTEQTTSQLEGIHPTAKINQLTQSRKVITQSTTISQLTEIEQKGMSGSEGIGQLESMKQPEGAKQSKDMNQPESARLEEDMDQPGLLSTIKTMPLPPTTVPINNKTSINVFMA